MDFQKGFYGNNCSDTEVMALTETLLSGWEEQIDVPMSQQWNILRCFMFPWFENMQVARMPYNKKNNYPEQHR